MLYKYSDLKFYLCQSVTISPCNKANFLQNSKGKVILIALSVQCIKTSTPIINKYVLFFLPNFCLCCTHHRNNHSDNNFETKN